MSTETELKGQVAVVTGVGSGIGRATATRFAEAGASVLAADIDAVTGNKTVADLRESGLEATFVQVDVSSEEQVKGMIDAALDAYGRLDILHNNAGILPVHPSIEETPFDVWRKVIAIDLDSVFLGCKYGVPAMKKSGGGRIMNTSSLAGIRGFMFGLHYSAAKGGVIMMTMGLAQLVEPDGIRVNAICPSTVATNLSAGRDPAMGALMAARGRPGYGRRLVPEDISRGALFLATKADFTGGAMIIDVTENNEPEYFVTFGYERQALEGA